MRFSVSLVKYCFSPEDLTAVFQFPATRDVASGATNKPIPSRLGILERAKVSSHARQNIDTALNTMAPRLNVRKTPDATNRQYPNRRRFGKTNTDSTIPNTKYKPEMLGFTYIPAARTSMRLMFKRPVVKIRIVEDYPANHRDQECVGGYLDNLFFPENQNKHQQQCHGFGDLYQHLKRDFVPFTDDDEGQLRHGSGGEAPQHQP